MCACVLCFPFWDRLVLYFIDSSSGSGSVIRANNVCADGIYLWINRNIQLVIGWIVWGDKTGKNYYFSFYFCPLIYCNTEDSRTTTTKRKRTQCVIVIDATHTISGIKFFILSLPWSSVWGATTYATNSFAFYKPFFSVLVACVTCKTIFRFCTFATNSIQRKQNKTSMCVYIRHWKFSSVYTWRMQK